MNEHLDVVARRQAATMRRRAWDRNFRPFHHEMFLRSPDVQRFVPGPTWEYVPPRDRPRKP